MGNSDNFNIDIHILDKKEIENRGIGEVKNTNILNNNSDTFDREGLFSTEIFGEVGSAIRNEKFGYINLSLPVIHPLVFKQISLLNKSFLGIISGKTRAAWDSKKKIFDISIDKNSDVPRYTGYSFFLENFRKIEFSKTDSLARSIRLDLTKKYTREENMMSYFLVLPAGLREYVVGKDGRASENEINDLYRKLIVATSLLKNISTHNSIEKLDPIRWRIQSVIQDIYTFITNFLGSDGGKNKFIQSRWAKRAIINGTRNVITPSPTHIDDLTAKERISANDTIIGLFQFLKAILPIAFYKLQKEFISNILNPNDSNSLLVDPSTMSSKLVNISVKKRDEWIQLDGVNHIITKLADPSIMVEPVKIDKYYLMLVEDQGGLIRCIRDTADLPEDSKKENFRPITYGELFFISIYDIKNKYPGLFTRYPVIEQGSIYPSSTYVKTTIKGRTVKLIKDGVERVLHEYPILNLEWVESLSCSPTHLEKLGGDFDGDKCSYNIVYTDEAIKEINELLNKPEYYINNKKIVFSSNTNTSSLTFKHMTSE